MTLYQELQLNQAGSKQLIRNTQDKKEKARHIAVYLFKILLTLAFCVAFVTVYTKVFGSDNSIVGVVVLLSVMTFRFADFGIHAPHALSSLMVIWGIMTFGPRLANAGNLVTELIVNMVCIFTLMILGCHNVVMFNQSTLLLGYLLLYGYDVSGTQYLYPASPSGIVCSESVYLYFSGTNERNPDSGSSGHPDLFYRIFVSGHQHGLYLLFSVRGKIRPVPFTLPVKRMYSGGGSCLYSSGILWKHRNLAGISCR